MASAGLSHRSIHTGCHWSVTLHTVEYPVVCYIQFSDCWSAWYNPHGKEFSLCAAAHHMPGIRGSELGHSGCTGAEGVKESVKDSYPGSFLKTSSQSRLSLCIVDIIESGRRVLSLESFN